MAKKFHAIGQRKFNSIQVFDTYTTSVSYFPNVSSDLISTTKKRENLVDVSIEVLSFQMEFLSHCMFILKVPYFQFNLNIHTMHFVIKKPANMKGQQHQLIPLYHSVSYGRRPNDKTGKTLSNMLLSIQLQCIFQKFRWRLGIPVIIKIL